MLFRPSWGGRFLDEGEEGQNGQGFMNGAQGRWVDLLFARRDPISWCDDVKNNMIGQWIGLRKFSESRKISLILVNFLVGAVLAHRDSLGARGRGQVTTDDRRPPFP